MSQQMDSPQQAGHAVGTKRDRSAQRRNRIVRLVVLAVSLLFITGIGIAHQRGVTVVGVDALCPFGGIETLWKLVLSATLVQRIAASSVILLAAVLLVAVVFRRAFCGSLCALGAVQEFFGKIGLVLFRGKRPVMSAAIDKPARYLKYVLLIGITAWTWQAATLVIRPYDPWVAWMHLTSPELLTEIGVGAAVLGISLAGSIVYDRFFCKYLCPMGGFLGAISRFSVFKVRRNDDTCIDCKACDKVCPTNVVVSTVDVVNSAECIDCNECVNVCPVKDTLEVSTSGWPGGGKKVAPLTVVGITLAIFLGVIAATTATGTFAWTVPTLSDTVEKSGGVVDVEEIRGRMTFAEISTATGIPEVKFQEKFGVKPDEMNTKISGLAETYGFDVHTDVREFITAELAEK